MTAIKTHCKWGHEFTPENTLMGRNGELTWQRCRQCAQDNNSKRIAKNLAKGLTANGKVPKKAGAKKLTRVSHKTNCPKGHSYAQFGRVANGWCKECKRLKSAAVADKNRAKGLTGAGKISSAMLIAEEQYTLGTFDLAKKNPLEYLKLSPIQAQREIEFNQAVDSANERGKGKPKCVPDRSLTPERQEEHRARWTDYDERNPPSKVQAALLCAGCPVIEQCALYAATLKLDGITMGGVAWVDGAPQR